MNMKKLIFMALIGSIYLSSCTSNQMVSPGTQAVVVSDAAKSTLKAAYPSATNVTWAEVTKTAVEASFVNKKEDLIIGIEKTGRMLFIAKSVQDATLPAISLDYLTATYPGYKLLRAGEKTDKSGATTGFMADIQVGDLFYHIHFDATGKFLNSEEKKGEHHGIGVQVLQANLPAAIKTYLSATYPGYKFNDAISFTLDAVVKGYGVRITTADNKEIGLMFDGAGVFLRSREGDLGHNSGMGPGHGHDGMGGPGQGGPNGPGRGKDGVSIVKIEKTALPAATLTYLDSKYAGYVFDRAGSISLNGVLSQYVVDIKVGDKKYAVIFDLAGAFIKELAHK
jgi:hypothetical protein